MATLTFTTKIDGALANVTSVALSDPTGTYGVKRNDTGATVIAAGRAMTLSAAGTYTYEFAPVGGVEYTFYVQWAYAGETHYVENLFTAQGDTIVLTGLTFEEVLASILVNDSHSMTTGHLGQLCGYHATTKPDIVFHAFPPERVKTPLLTYRINGEYGHFPRTIFVDILAWGGDTKKIHNRVYTLLHKRLQISATDWQIKGVMFESAGPVLYDEKLKVLFQRARYWAKVLKA